MAQHIFYKHHKKSVKNCQKADGKHKQTQRQSEMFHSSKWSEEKKRKTDDGNTQKLRPCWGRCSYTVEINKLRVCAGVLMNAHNARVDPPALLTSDVVGGGQQAEDCNDELDGRRHGSWIREC